MAASGIRLAAWTLVALVPLAARAGDLPDWTAKIRPDHPRLFFNADTWPTTSPRPWPTTACWSTSWASRRPATGAARSRATSAASTASSARSSGPSSRASRSSTQPATPPPAIATELLQRDGLRGVRLTTGRNTWEVTFNTAGELGGHVKFSGGPQAIDTDLATQVEPQSGIMADPQ